MWSTEHVMDATDAKEPCGPGIYCVRCGYDLRVTPKTGICPECREVCEASLWIRTHAGQRWRRRMHRGAIWLAVAAMARLLPGAGTMLATWFGYPVSYGVYYWCEWVLWWTVPLSIGALLITTPFEPDRGRRRWAVPIRLVARWVVLLWAFQEVAAPLLYFALTFNGVEGASSPLMLPPAWSRVFAVSVWMNWPIWMTGLLGLLAHIFIIAARLRSKRLLMQLRTLAVLLAAWSVVAYNVDWFHRLLDRGGSSMLATVMDAIDVFVHSSTWWTEFVLESWAVVLMLWLARMYSTPLPEHPVESG